MKRLFILTLFFVSNYSIAQLHVGLELGGSNFLGYSANIEQNITLSRASSISGKAGFGGLFPGWPAVPTALFQFGIHYNYKNWGIGADGSKFIARNSPGKRSHSMDINLLLYPNIYYRLKFKRSYFIKFSAGAYFAYDQVNDLNSRPKFQWAGDVIPGIGIALGKTFYY